jgi:Spy/CpxP family protein refolding chaperone
MRSLLVVVLALAVAGMTAFGQEPAKAKKSLPKNWSKLNLSATQKEQAYKLVAEHAEKVAALKKQLEEVDVQYRKSLNSLLTPDQRAKLVELATGENPEKPTKPQKP